MFISRLKVIILAAGIGKRMCSTYPKVMHTIGDKPMIQHVIDVALQLFAVEIYIVYDAGSTLLLDYLNKKDIPVSLVLQNQPLGTGHAVQQVLSKLQDNDEVLILYGDVPLITKATLLKLLSVKLNDGIGLLTVVLDDPGDYGRIIRKDGNVVGIVEYNDADVCQHTINEVNTGIIAIMSHQLKYLLNQITNNNIKSEFYLTDIISIAWNAGYKIHAIHPIYINETQGVNNKFQLAKVERYYQFNQAKRLSLDGVMFADLNRFDLRGQLLHGSNVYIDNNVTIEGQVSLGSRVKIGVGCIIKNTIVGDDVTILPYTLIDGSCLKNGSTVGPFARLRRGSNLDELSKVGNFVEMKNANIGEKSKINHFSYIGDADIGVMVNIGAGTITCNYDGINKCKTIIEDQVFIGSGSQLVAPVTIGKKSIVGAGTTVTDNVSPNKTIISRIRQFAINSNKKFFLRKKK